MFCELFIFKINRWLVIFGRVFLNFLKCFVIILGYVFFVYRVGNLERILLFKLKKNVGRDKEVSC